MHMNEAYDLSIFEWPLKTGFTVTITLDADLLW